MVANYSNDMYPNQWLGANGQFFGTRDLHIYLSTGPFFLGGPEKYYSSNVYRFIFIKEYFLLIQNQKITASKVASIAMIPYWKTFQLSFYQVFWVPLRFPFLFTTTHSQRGRCGCSHSLDIPYVQYQNRGLVLQKGLNFKHNFETAFFVSRYVHPGIGY